LESCTDDFTTMHKDATKVEYEDAEYYCEKGVHLSIAVLSMLALQSLLLGIYLYTIMKDRRNWKESEELLRNEE